MFTVVFCETVVLEPYPPPNKTALDVVVDCPNVPPVTLMVVVVAIVPDAFDPPYTAPFI